MENAKSSVWLVSGNDLRVLAERASKDPNFRDLLRADVRSAAIAAGIVVPDGAVVKLPSSFYTAVGLPEQNCCG